ncbi:MAG: homoserine dehydrogenase, partial [Bacteroidia bacterium]|nr:homoserine dehydrogenase [Bacteroidia bacterium]
GFGCVGQGLWDVISKTKGIKADIKKICVKDREKQRPVDSSYFTFDKNELLSDPEIDVIVELIDNADDAYHIVKTALQNGKGVVSANKKLIANHLEELLELQRIHNVPFLYEASCCASIPIIRNFEEYYDNDLLQSLKGIVNGSTNYILTKTFRDNLSYADALTEAQEKGYAESDPSLDVEGFDAKYKLTILVAHAFGIIARPEQIHHLGISRIGALELQYAREKNLKIKLVAHAAKINDNEVCAFVIPEFISSDNKLYNVDDVYNGVELETSFADKQFFSGKGAGSHPTASAVLSDISALSYNYRYEYKKLSQNQYILSDNVTLEVLVRYSKKEDVKTSDFETISESYSSLNQHYLIGKINLGKLFKSQWAKNPYVSIIATANNILTSTKKSLKIAEPALQ